VADVDDHYFITVYPIKNSVRIGRGPQRVHPRLIRAMTQARVATKFIDPLRNKSDDVSCGLRIKRKKIGKNLFTI
jgi:hypothetical protein